MKEDLILQRLEAIEHNSLLAAKNVLTIDDVASLTGLGKNYIYNLTSKKKIPHYKPSSRLLYFDRKDIEDWMKRNRQNTQTEAEQSAAAYVVAHQ